MKNRKTKLIVLFLAAMIACVGAGCTDNTAKTGSSSVTSSAAASEDESKSEVSEESNTQSKTESEAGESSAESINETPASDSIDYMALVNKTHPLPEDWEDKLETVHMTNSVGDDVEVEKKAYDAYLRLKEELEKEDIHG